MALANVIYPADGILEDYLITFGYLSQDNVEVYVDNVLTSDGSSLYSATFQDATTVRVTAISGGTPVPAGSSVVLQRNTPTNSASVVFADGAVVRATALNKNTNQMLFIAQEVKDESSSRLATNNSGNYDAQNNRIINVADPVDNTDAVNKQFISTNLPNINTVAGIATDVTGVAAIASDVTAVQTNASNVTTVAGINADVTLVAGVVNSVPTVAGIDTDVTAVAVIASDVTTVAGINTNVTTVAGMQANVASVVADEVDIGIVAGLSTEVTALGPVASGISTLSPIVADVTATASNATDISTVAGLSTEVAALGPISSDISTVAGIQAAVVNVAGQQANVTTVAGIDTDVTTLAAVAADITAAAGISSDITAVAAQVTDVQAVAADLLEATSEIDTVANAIVNIDAVGGDITNVNTVANNLTSVNAFANQYVISATAPTGVEGMLWFDTTTDTMKVYGDSGFANAGSSVNGIDNSVSYTVGVGGQSIFTATYDAGYISVFVNGIRLDDADFTASNGTSVTLNDAAVENDIVAIQAFGTFSLVNAQSNDLTDVDISGGTSGDLVVIDGSGGMTTQTPPTPIATVSELTDVDTSGGSTGDFLVLDGTGAVTTQAPAAPETDPSFTTVTATGAVEGGSVVVGGFTLSVDGSGNLIFTTGGTNVAKLETTGDLTVIGNLTAYGTI